VRANADDLLARGIITEAARTRAMVGLDAAIGGSELLGELTGADAAALREVQQRLIMGSDAALNARFPDDDTRQAMARRLSGRITHLEGIDRASAKASKDYEDMALVMRGAAEPSDRSRTLLDQGIEIAIGAKLTPEAWMLGDVTDARVFEQIRASGVGAPDSLLGAFRQFERGRAGPQGVANMMSLWRELGDGRFPDGSPADVASSLPDRTIARLTLTEFFLKGGDGEASAYEKAGELTVKPVDPSQLAAMQQFDTGGLISASEVTPENARAKVREGLRTALNERLGADIQGRDLAQAEVLYGTLVVSGGMDHDGALSAIGRQMEQRIPETKFIYDGIGQGWPSRSNMAPEKFFAMADDPGFIGRQLGKRTWFERWAESAIRDGVGIEAATRLKAGALRPGRDGDYSLQPDLRATGSPVYRVMMQLDDDPFPDVVLGRDGSPLLLDARDEHAMARSIGLAVEIVVEGDAVLGAPAANERARADAVSAPAP